MLAASPEDDRRSVTDRRDLPRGGRRKSDVDRLAQAVPKFTCPGCGESASKVTNGRPVLGQLDEIYRRTRCCLWCGYVFKTDEKISAE